MARVFLIFLLTIHYSLSMAFMSSPVILIKLKSIECGQVPSPSGKWNQHLIKLVSRRKQTSPDIHMCSLRSQENAMNQQQQLTWFHKSSQTIEMLHWRLYILDSLPHQPSSILCEMVTKHNTSNTIYSFWTLDHRATYQYFFPKPARDTFNVYLRFRSRYTEGM